MTTQELYDALLAQPDLHSLPQMQGDLLVWQLYKEADVHIFCNGSITIEIVGHNLLTIARWQLGEEGVIDQLCTFGKRGNLLVLKKSLYGTQLFYTGPADDFPQIHKPPLHWGSKKWDGGQLIYLEQK